MSSYELCYCRPVTDRAADRACIDRVSVCSFGGAIPSRNRHTCVELLTFRTLNEGLKAFRVNLMYWVLFSTTVGGLADEENTPSRVLVVGKKSSLLYKTELAKAHLSIGRLLSILV